MNFELINNSNQNVCVTIENKTKVLPAFISYSYKFNRFKTKICCEM